ncbi:Lipocalin-like protein [Sulfitobacter noctilucicola]|uniref:Apolipoprotein D and lipocalin family protein n=1 Tax=Sulfitobacter noctilucicola TaxID=1342301 RepID=A0A7W6MA68_9RHOB|nr:hypothetical protein [Sulfitobacter noctilucicola]KIN63959.1 Lipocalin-like protein [Sulfitobacter noctilucicola]MBB4175316.1 apolipoprotein D and lipocalin family protein [Sulfitobacter noctilucicola]
MKSPVSENVSVTRLGLRAAMGAMAMFLVGCTAEPLPEIEIGLRNPTVPLGGTSRFEAGRFAGDWQTVRCLGECERSVTYQVATDGVFLRRAGDTLTAYSVPAPGILREMGGDSTLVVMWVDEGFRTAAVGDADGRWAAVLGRSRKTAPDRVKAATEILDFNGWDIAKMQVVK